MSTDPARGHDSWIKIKGWRDSVDHQTGRRQAQIGQPADFSGWISEETRGSFRNPVRVFAWRISRQRTEREGPDEHGLHWAPDLAAGEAPNLAKAKSAATTALRAQRTEHILAGGDVGYGAAPTGDQIRASIAARRALQPGQSMVLESGELGGVQWERRLSMPNGTISATESYRMTYGTDQVDALPRGRTPAEAAAELKAHVDSRPERVAAAEAERAAAISESIRIDLERDHRWKRLNVLDHTEVAAAYKAHTGNAPTKTQLIHWARGGVTEAEHNAEWYQRGMAAKQARASQTPVQLRDQARREQAAGLDYEATETAHQADVAAGEPAWRSEMTRQREEQRAAGERMAQGLQRSQALHNAKAAHMREATGITFPHPGDLGGHPGDDGAWAASDHFLAGRVTEAADALDRQAAGETSKARAAKNRTLAAHLRAAEVKTTLPALAKVRGTPAGMTAVDHEGAEYTVSLRDGQVSVTSPAGTVSAPAGDDPTAAARALAGRLNAQAGQVAASAFAELDRATEDASRERVLPWEGDAPADDGSLARTEGYRTLGRLSKGRPAEHAAPAAAGRQSAFPDMEPEA